LEEIDELYRSKVPAWKSSSWRPSTKRAAIDAVEGRRFSEATMVDKAAQKGEAGHIEAPKPSRGSPSSEVKNQTDDSCTCSRLIQNVDR
jgi:hypothetical protein